MPPKSFYAHGKLMLTGEYTVLDGAKSIAIPTKFGQRMDVNILSNSSAQIDWKSYDSLNKLWLNARLPSLNLTKEEDLRLQNIIHCISNLNPDFFYQKNYKVETFLEFPNNWGLGSSSTLISLLAQWSAVDPYVLLEKTFGGSGYDIACATSETALSYQIIDGNPTVEDVDLSESWTNNAYFIFLEKKQNSRDAIKAYKELSNAPSNAKLISDLSNEITRSKSLDEVMRLFSEHEKIMSKLLKTTSINTSKFADFNGVCKSLGAWGGDFIMALTSEDRSYINEYFAKKGLKTIFAYNEMIWKQN